NRTNAKLAPNLVGIDVPALVTKDRVASHHPQLWQLRKTIDDALGDSVRQILGIRIACIVYKGQNRERVDGLARPPTPTRARLSRSDRFQPRAGTCIANQISQVAGEISRVLIAASRIFLHASSNDPL